MCCVCAHVYLGTCGFFSLISSSRLMFNKGDLVPANNSLSVIFGPLFLEWNKDF